MIISKDETVPYTTEHTQDTIIMYGDCSTQVTTTSHEW